MIADYNSDYKTLNCWQQIEKDITYSIQCW